MTDGPTRTPAESPAYDLEPTAEQDQLRATVRKFLAQHSSETAVRSVMETPEGYDAAVWERLAGQLGLQGLAVPEELGGFAADVQTQTVVFEELGRSLLCAPYFATVALAANAVRECAGTEAQQDYLPGMADGSRIATLALGAVAGSLRGRADDDGTWSVDGIAEHVVDGQNAGLVLCVADTTSGPALLAVEALAVGLSVDAIEALDQTRRLARLTFTGVPARRVDAAGRMEAGLQRTLDLAAVALAAEQVGAAAYCLEMSVEHARTRVQFGRAIGSFQAVKHRCADMYVDLDSAEAVLRYAAWAADADPGDLPLAASLAKSYCSDVARTIVTHTIQLHGGIGFTWEHPAHLYLKRVIASSALLGTPVEHRKRLAGLVAPPL